MERTMKTFNGVVKKIFLISALSLSILPLHNNVWSNTESTANTSIPSNITEQALTYQKILDDMGRIENAKGTLNFNNEQEEKNISDLTTKLTQERTAVRKKIADLNKASKEEQDNMQKLQKERNEYWNTQQLNATQQIHDAQEAKLADYDMKIRELAEKIKTNNYADEINKQNIELTTISDTLRDGLNKFKSWQSTFADNLKALNAQQTTLAAKRQTIENAVPLDKIYAELTRLSQVDKDLIEAEKELNALNQDPTIARKQKDLEALQINYIKMKDSLEADIEKNFQDKNNQEVTLRKLRDRQKDLNAQADQIQLLKQDIDMYLARKAIVEFFLKYKDNRGSAPVLESYQQTSAKIAPKAELEKLREKLREAEVDLAFEEKVLTLHQEYFGDKIKELNNARANGQDDAGILAEIRRTKSEGDNAIKASNNTIELKKAEISGIETQIKAQEEESIASSQVSTKNGANQMLQNKAPELYTSDDNNVQNELDSSNTKCQQQAEELKMKRDILLQRKQDLMNR